MTFYCVKCNAEMESAGFANGKCRPCYYKEEAEKYDAFKRELARDYDVVGHPKFERCFSLAWEHGHSSGYSDVRNYFSDFVELIK